MDVGKIEFNQERLPPNIEALFQGCMSGRYGEWPQLRAEVRKLVGEVGELRKRVTELERELKNLREGK